MGLNKQSWQVVSFVGKIGQMPTEGIANTRMDMYDEEGNLIQQRWFGQKKEPLRNRDWRHGNKGGKHEFPHDHLWGWVKGKYIRDTKPSLVDLNFK